MDDDRRAVSAESLEGRIIAHRKLLALLVAHLPQGAQAAAVRTFLDERSAVQDGQEDPGAAPTLENALLLAQADELRLIAERAAEEMPNG